MGMVVSSLKESCKNGDLSLQLHQSKRRVCGWTAYPCSAIFDLVGFVPGFSRSEHDIIDISDSSDDEVWQSLSDEEHISDTSSDSPHPLYDSSCRSTDPVITPMKRKVIQRASKTTAVARINGDVSANGDSSAIDPCVPTKSATAGSLKGHLLKRSRYHGDSSKRVVYPSQVWLRDRPFATGNFLWMLALIC
jgi:hypothetical protein